MRIQEPDFALELGVPRQGTSFLRQRKRGEGILMVAFLGRQTSAFLLLACLSAVTVALFPTQQVMTYSE